MVTKLSQLVTLLCSKIYTCHILLLFLATIRFISQLQVILKMKSFEILSKNLASSEAGAQTRNTFKVVPYAGELDDICLGSPLRFNQVFCLQSVCNPDFYLASDSIRKLNTLSNIAYGRNEVFLVDKKSRVSS